MKGWSQHIFWGNHRCRGGVLTPTALRGRATSCGATARRRRAQNIVWGENCDGAGCDNIVWGNNIVWGDLRRRQHRLGRRRWRQHRLGQRDGDNIVWGNDVTDNIVWGNADGDNIVWGTDCGGADCDNIVWGETDGDNSCGATPKASTTSSGATADGDNIVWGTGVTTTSSGAAAPT